MSGIDFTPLKRCPTCKAEKPRTEFYKNKITPDGLRAACKACHYATTERWRKANREKVNEIARRHRAKYPELVAERSRVYNRKKYREDAEYAAIIRARTKAKYHANKEEARLYQIERRRKKAKELSAYARNYYSEHAAVIKARTKARNERFKIALRPYNTARVQARNALKKKAIPLWANLDVIAALYDTASDLSAATGIKHEVDHIVPLQSKLVCGLHCEANLRVIPRVDNRTKGNRWWPDCPDDTHEIMVNAMARMADTAPPEVRRRLMTELAQ